MQLKTACGNPPILPLFYYSTSWHSKTHSNFENRK
jgi:hypothetical protein